MPFEQLRLAKSSSKLLSSAGVCSGRWHHHQMVQSQWPVMRWTNNSTHWKVVHEFVRQFLCSKSSGQIAVTQCTRTQQCMELQTQRCVSAACMTSEGFHSMMFTYCNPLRLKCVRARVLQSIACSAICRYFRMRYFNNKIVNGVNTLILPL